MPVQQTAETELVRNVYVSINRNDIAGALKDFDSEVLRVEPEGFPMSGTYRGLATMKEHFTTARATWAEGGCEPQNFIVAGDKVVVFLHVLVRLKDKLEWIDGHMGDVFVIQNGKIVEMRSFVTPEEAMRWAGL